jgi:hypothetical protein
MTLKSAILGCAVAAALTLPAQAASLLNASFETGDTASWDVANGVVEVVTDADDQTQSPIFGEHYTATDGDQFAKVIAGENGYTTLSQLFTLTTLSRISFDAAFLAFDEVNYDDDAFVRVRNLTTNVATVLFSSSVSAVGDYGHTSWARFSSDFLVAGDYVFEAGVQNGGGDTSPDYSSQLLLDNVGIAVPEPSTWAMMLLGFGALGAALRQRRNAAAAA